MPEIQKILDRIIWDKWSKNKTADIKLSGLDFVMDTMPFKARFKHSVQDEKPFTYEAEGKSISFKPAGMWWTTLKGKTAASAVASAIGSLTKGKVKYLSALGNGIDIELSTERTRWRKEIIIKSLQSLGAIPADAEYLEIGFEIETDFEIEGWDKKSELKFNTAVKLSELSQLESIKAWDSYQPTDKEVEEGYDALLRCDGFLRVQDGKYYLVKRISVEYLQRAVYPVTTDVEIAYGLEYEFNTTFTTDISCAALDATHFVVAFQDAGGDDYGIAMIGVVSSGDQIAYGSEYTFNAAVTSYTSCAALDATHFVVAYRGTSDYGYAKIGVVTGDAIAYGAEYEFKAAFTSHLSCAALDDTHFVVGCQAVGGHAKIGIVSSGDQIAYGSEYTFNVLTSYFVSCAKLDSTHFAVVYQDTGGDDYGHAKIGIVSSGDQIAYGSEYTFNAAVTTEISCAALDDTHFVVVFRDAGDGNKGKAIIGVVTGDAIAYGSEYEFNAADAQVISCAALDATHFVVVFRDYGGEDYGIAMIGVVTGDAIAFSSEYEFNAADTRYIFCATLDDTHFVVAYRDQGGDYYGICRIGVLTAPPPVYEESCSDGIKSGDTPAAQCVFNPTVTDGLKPGDSPASIGTFGMGVADGAKIGDTPVGSLLLSLLASDGVKIGDTPIQNLILGLLATDGAKFGDTLTIIKILNLLATDGVELSDTLSKQTTFNPALSDGVSLGDTPLAQAIFDNILTDGAKFGDSALGSLLLDLSLADGVKLGDTPLGQLVLGLVLSDGVELGDTPLGQLVLDLTVADGVKLSEALAAIGIFGMGVSDGVKIGDTPLANLILNLALTDGITLSDLDLIDFAGKVLLVKVITGQYRDIKTITAQYRLLQVLTSQYREVKSITAQHRIVKLITTMLREIKSHTAGG